jgi:galactokinase
VREASDPNPRDALVARFRTATGRRPEAAFRAPGRVNLIGEHTDYNEGFVLPCAIDRDTQALAAPREDGVFTGASREDAKRVRFAGGSPERPGGWGDYVWGVAQALGERGAPLPGADLAVASDVPVGAGLSSSAALCVALVGALDTAFALGLDSRARAEIAHRAECFFVGVPCGVMDQMASSLGRRDHALRIDCRSLEVELVPLPARLRLLVADSGVRRRLADGAYGNRRAECEEALRLARERGVGPAGARALRDLSPRDLPALERALPPVLARRARHVVCENERVDATARALAAGDLASAGAQLKAGMRSLRDDFEVSIPELDALCEIADALPGVYGSRLSGAGFGGCTLHLVDADAASAVAEALARGFESRFGRRPAIHAVRAADGAAALALPVEASGR